VLSPFFFKPCFLEDELERVCRRFEGGVWMRDEVLRIPDIDRGSEAAGVPGEISGVGDCHSGAVGRNP
jgi:hypothetical protein